MQMSQNPKDFEKIILNAKTILVVGLSRDPKKESNNVAQYLQNQGYRIIPINPSGEEILGQKSFKTISEIKEKIDIVDVFRPGPECEQITKEALKLEPKMVWLQLGIENENAKKLADKEKVVFVQNKCIRIEHKRLAGLK